MTPQDLDRLVAYRDFDGIVEATRHLTEAERRKLSKHASQLHQLVKRFEWADRESEPDVLAKINERFTAIGFKVKSRWHQLGRNAWTSDNKVPAEMLTASELLCFALCPISVTRRLNGQPTHQNDDKNEQLIEILDARRPEWASDWLQTQFDHEWPDLSWQTARTLIHKGICSRPDADGYIRCFAQYIVDWGSTETEAIKRLKDDPDLLAFEIWKLFEVDTPAFTWDAKPDQGWTKVLLMLSAEGTIDRGRLLDASLDGTTSGLGEHLLGGFAKFHRHLNPSSEELAERQSRYQDILSSSSPRVVGFGVDMLKALQKAGSLNKRQLLNNFAPVFNVRTKGPAKSAIALLKMMGKHDPSLIPDAAVVLSEALEHSAIDVQEAALNLLGSWTDSLDPQVVNRVSIDCESLAPTLRARAQELFASPNSETETSISAGLIDVEPSVSMEDLNLRRLNLAARLDELFEISTAIEAISDKNVPSPVAWPITQVPVLTTVERIAPIETIDELIETVAHAIEVIDDANDIDRMFDAMVRLLEQRPDDFESYAAPLWQRLGDPTPYSGGTFAGCDLHTFAGAISLRTWLDPGRSKLYRNRIDDGWQKNRFEEITTWIRDGVSRPMLAAPTHAGGWIEPTTLVQRMLDLQARDLKPGIYDTIQALLRITPDGRETALEQSRKLIGETGSAVQWALGSDPQDLDPDCFKSESLWLAAGRSRAPFKSLPDLASRISLPLAPDGMEPASWQFSASHKPREFCGVSMGSYPNLDVSISPPPSRQPDHPTCGPHWRDSPTWNPNFLDWSIHWNNMIWPMNPAHSFHAGIDHLVWQINERTTPSYVASYLVTLLDRDRPWSEIAQFALWIGLLSLHTESRTLCLDAMIEGIEDGRADPEALGQTLAKLSEGQWLKLNRLATNLNEIVRVSPRHAWVISVCLDRLIAAFDPIPRDAHHVLTVFRECLTQLGIPASPETQSVLANIEGKGKSAKLAQAIREHRPNEPTADYQQAQWADVEARIRRAERWSSGSPELHQQSP